MNDLTVMRNRLSVLVNSMSPLAGPIMESCSVLSKIIQKISNAYKLKEDGEIVSS